MRLEGSSGRNQAYQYLRTVVLTDPRVLGTFINEQQVATAVGVSRTPVREALLMLGAEAFVQLIPHRGAFVAPAPGREIAEMMQARTLIECWAAVTCIGEGRRPHLAMGRLLARQQALLEEGSAHDFIELDRQFHVLLVQAGGNAVLDRMYEGMQARHVLLGVVAIERSSTRRKEVLEEHQAILDALVAGDRTWCEQAIHRHLDTTREVLTSG